MTTNYSRGDSKKIIVGAAALFINDTINTVTALPDVGAGFANQSYKEQLAAEDSGWTSVGFTTNGLELTFQPDFGEVKVDQMLDVAKLYKQGMKVELKTTFAEATLENLIVATASSQEVGNVLSGDSFDMNAGELGEYPVERSLIAVGASTQPASGKSERIYHANRVISIQNVAVAAKRDAVTEFEVTFRLLPQDSDSSYGTIVDRTYTTV